MLDFMVVPPKRKVEVEATPSHGGAPSRQGASRERGGGTSTRGVGVEEQWGQTIDKTLKKRFGFDSFRPLQRDIVLSVLGGGRRA